VGRVGYCVALTIASKSVDSFCGILCSADNSKSVDSFCDTKPLHLQTGTIVFGGAYYLILT
jgi:hypothetical protein